MLRRLALAALVWSLATTATEAASLARYRLLHALPGGPEVDVYLDGEQATARLGYGSLLPYRSLRAGVHNFKAVPSGGSAFLDDRDTTLEAGRDYTIALVMLNGEPGWLRIHDRRPEAPGGYARAVHLAAGGPPLDFLAAGQRLSTLTYGQVSRPAPVTSPDVVYSFQTASAAEPLARSEPLNAASGATLTIFLIGQAGAEGALAPRLLADLQTWPEPDIYGEAPLAEPPADGRARLRLVHLSPGAANLSPRLDGQPLLVDPLAYGRQTDYIAVTPGSHRFASGDGAAAGREIVLDGACHYTLLMVDRVDRMNLWLLRDEQATGATRVRVVNGAGDLPAATVSLGDGTVLAEAVAYPAATDYLPLPVGQEQVRFRLQAAHQDTVLRSAEAWLQTGGSYTLVVSGSAGAGPADMALGLTLLKDG